MTAKVLDFPKTAIVRPPLTEDVQNRIKSNRRNFYDMLSMQEANEILSALYSAGIDIKDPDFVKRFSIGMEFIRSAIYGTFQEEHPFHPMADAFAKSLGMTSQFETTEIDLDNDPE